MIIYAEEVLNKEEIPATPTSKLLALIKHPEYYGFTQYKSSGQWKMDLYNEVIEELKKRGELEGVEYIEPESVSKEDVSLIHTPEYVEDIMGNPKKSHMSAWSGGPWDESAQKAVLRSTGGMIRTNQEALNRGMAIQLYDAFHHAYPEHGEGYCVLNDVAIAAKKTAKEGKRILIVDADVHQGQGTAVCLKDDPNIYTLSLHEKYNYPSQKEKSSLDVEYEDKIKDNQFLKLFKDAINKAIEYFGWPDLVMYIAGTDMFGGDVSSHTKITLKGMQRRDEFIFSLFGSKGIPVSVSIPQGYGRDPEDTKTLIGNTIKSSQEAFNKYYNQDIKQSGIMKNYITIIAVEQDTSAMVLSQWLEAGYREVVWIYQEEPWSDESKWLEMGGVCPTCKALDGQRFKIADLLNEMEYDAAKYTKSHVGCKCLFKRVPREEETLDFSNEEAGAEALETTPQPIEGGTANV
jgi:acetoin utilization deacetylase AcuC-like enzyme